MQTPLYEALGRRRPSAEAVQRDTRRAGQQPAITDAQDAADLAQAAATLAQDAADVAQGAANAAQAQANTGVANAATAQTRADEGVSAAGDANVNANSRFKRDGSQRMDGTLQLRNDQDPSNNDDAAKVKQVNAVDNKLGDKLDKTGGTLTGNTYVKGALSANVLQVYFGTLKRVGRSKDGWLYA